MTSAKKKTKVAMIKSMTGFGRGHASGKTAVVEIEISTVNRRQFDARINMPRALLVLESRIQKILRGSISRGGVNCNIRVTPGKNAAAASVVANEEMAEAAIKKVQSIALNLGLDKSISASDVLQIPGVLQVKKEEYDAEKTWKVIRQALLLATAHLNAMRTKEGAALFRDVSKRVTKLTVMADKIKARVPFITRKYKKELLKRLRESGIAAKEDRHEFIREVAQFSDRSDISEELTRLDSHFVQAEELLSSAKPVGRTLDFLCQEILREINTVGSKASDSKVARTVVLFKTELEAIREQIQNIE